MIVLYVLELQAQTLSNSAARHSSDAFCLDEPFRKSSFHTALNRLWLVSGVRKMSPRGNDFSTTEEGFAGSSHQWKEPTKAAGWPLHVAALKSHLSASILFPTLFTLPLTISSPVPLTCLFTISLCLILTWQCKQCRRSFFLVRQNCPDISLHKACFHCYYYLGFSTHLPLGQIPTYSKEFSHHTFIGTSIKLSDRKHKLKSIKISNPYTVLL